MPGHMGNRKVTLQNIKVVDVKEDQNLLLLKGGIPGSPRRMGPHPECDQEERSLLPHRLKKGNGMTTLAVYDIGNQKVSDIELDGPDL